MNNKLYAAKLSEEAVREIRAKYKLEKMRAINVIELAKQYNVTQETIRNVVKGHTYSWVK